MNETCRSPGCLEESTWYAFIEPKVRIRGKDLLWTGYFCHEHLQRVMPFKFEDMLTGDRLMIEKLRPPLRIPSGEPV